MKWIIEQYWKTLRANLLYVGLAILYLLYTLYRAKDNLTSGQLYTKIGIFIFLLLLIWTGFALQKKINVALVLLVVGILAILGLFYFVTCRGESIITFSPQMCFGIQ